MTGPDDRVRGEHPDDLLSAHVDGELGGATEARVAAHLDGCAECREAVAAIAGTRSLLRDLPPVDAAPVIEGFLGRHRRAIRLGSGFVVLAGLVLVALGLNAGTDQPRVVPDVAALAASHVAGAHGEMDGMRPSDGSVYVAPPGLIGSAVQLGRHEVWDGPDLAAVVYRDGGVDVSVYEQPGRLDWDALPPGDLVAMGDELVWFARGLPVVAVAQRGDLVLTVVSDDRPAVITAVAGMPEWRRRATWDRVHDACQRLVQAFALSG